MYIVQIGLTNVSEPLQRQQHYIPTRAGPGWNPSEQTLQTNSSNSHNRGLSPIQDSPVELPAQPSTVGMPRKDRTSEYYEDVDPRFAEPIAYNPQPGPMPSSLMPGGFSNPNLLNISNPSLITVIPIYNATHRTRICRMVNAPPLCQKRHTSPQSRNAE